VTTCCEPCLRHAHLIAHLAPRIAGMLDRPRDRVSGVLRLEESELIERVAPHRVEAVKEFLQGFRPKQARETLDAKDISAVCGHDAAYPAKLRDLADPPRVLFCTGSLERLTTFVEEPAATIVGSRRASPYALEVARQLGRGLGAAGLTVVSGLALGIDAAAHVGALEAHAAAIAVLACGPDLVYPSQHRALYRRLVRQGIVMSEMPPGTRALRWGFPARNRIMAAVGAITVVVEAGDPSGSLITANFAADLGRAVGAVPGRITVSVAEGSNRLLREGAALIRGPEDVLDEVFGIGNRPLARSADVAGSVTPELDPAVRQVLARVELGETVGQIAADTGMPVSAVRAALAQLEREGLIVPGALGWWERAPKW
jgi:DNA processing protein